MISSQISFVTKTPGECTSRKFYHICHWGSNLMIQNLVKYLEKRLLDLELSVVYHGC